MSEEQEQYRTDNTATTAEEVTAADLGWTDVGEQKARRRAKAWKKAAHKWHKQARFLRAVNGELGAYVASQAAEAESLYDYYGKVDQAEKHVANRERYIAVLRAKLARAEEEIRRARQEAGRERDEHTADQIEYRAEQQRSARRLALLRQVQWCSYLGYKNHDGDVYGCPLCDQPEGIPHSPDCPLGAEMGES